ncbi:stage III sporulation protein AH [Clostridium acidisoli DSM 12555]|uniref:Stage III sporulation protein AH n=1 Tax=Clostridium acidisoli DSM 12555 TaxID=1121291 RepID=A0A1W1X2C0_9CLOT|nr:SpoIIIAH-like family protein [Clostridium acidisoli]SMC17561.1 stage III sporulation protein AH [Clostridium acidisoli DSM 12555]
MNRKQAVIIVALLVLIVCAGVLATKVQSPLYVSDTDLVDNSSTNDTNSTTNGTNQTTNLNKSNKTSSNQDYFAEARLTREKTSEDTIATLKEIIDDKNSTAQNKQNAQQESMSIILSEQNSMKVENMLKGKGYKDALCTINNDKVNIVVKSDASKLTDAQQREIRDVALTVTQIRNIEIQPPIH